MEHMLGLPSEGCGQNSIENNQKDLPYLELAMDGAPSLQSSVSDACSLVDTVGSLTVPMSEDLNNVSKDDEINENQCEESLSDSKAVKSHEMDFKIEIDNPGKNNVLSNGAPSDQTTMQEHCIEGNLLSCKHDGLDDTGHTASFCYQEDTQMEQATLSSKTCITEVVDSEKFDNGHVCLKSENNIACCEAELVEESASADVVKKFHSSGAELGKLGEDEAFKARTADLIAVEASDKAHSGDTDHFLTTTGINTSSSDVAGIEEKGSHICGSSSPIILVEAEVIYDHDAKHMAASETACLVLQGLLSEPIEEIAKEGNVGSTDCAPDGYGPSELTIHSCQDAKASIEEYVTRNSEEHLNAVVQSETKSIGDAEESTETEARDAGDENTLAQKCLPGLSEDLSLEDHLSSGTVFSIVEVSKESSEDDDSYDCEDSMSAAPYLSATSSVTPRIRIMEQKTLNTQCSIDHTNVGANVECNTLAQKEARAASSERQHHECTVDKDGGSSMDSTAGTGLQQSDGCAPVEDEEASSTGGEETASSPARIQPLRQQRKKINIHHQFVREIVKIQHDREQYDREPAGRQIQAQQAATLPQVGRKTSDIKEQKSSETRDFRGETNKEKGFKDVGAHRQLKDSQQMQSTKNKKSLAFQSRNESSNQWSFPQERHEQSQQAFPLAMGAKGHGTIGRGKPQRSTSIYRPPVVRDALAAGHRNMGERETSNRQSGAYAMSSSLDSSASSFVESRVPIASFPHFVNVEGSSKMGSSSGEYFADSETHAEHSAHGMGIKVTFDTEKSQRHIEFSDGLDNLSKGEQPSPAASHSSSGYRVNKETKYKPSLSHTFQDSKFSPGGRQQIDNDETSSKGNDRNAVQAARSANPVFSRPFQDSSFSSGSRQIDHGERPSKGNDRHFMQSARTVNPSHRHPFHESKFSSGSRQIDYGETPSKGNEHHFPQAATSGYLYGFPSADPSQTRVRAGRPSNKPTEKKSTFWERADNSANLQNLSARLQKSPPPLIRHGSDSQNISASSTRRSDWYAGTPNPSSQSFSTPSSQRTALLGPSFERGFFGSTSFAGADARSEEFERAAMNIPADIQHQQFNTQNQQFNTPRSHDFRGNAQYAVTTDNSRGKKGPQKNSTKDFSSPFQAMMKDVSRPQAAFSASAQRSADANEDSRGFGSGWHAKDHTQTQSHETVQESLRRSQSDASRKAFTQNSPSQLSSSPVTESLFCTMPMQEKWGDIVDDLTDSYDYLQIKSDGGERETHSGSLPYGASQSIASFTNSKVSKPIFRDPKQDRGMPKYSYKETFSSQKHTDVTREHLACDTPARKSVFERLGPQNNFQESILGPPPKMLDSRGVLKASPDALISNVSPVSTFKSFDTGFYGLQWASHSPSMQHEDANDDEGQEVVVQAYTEVKQRRSKRELYVPRRGS